MEKPNADHADHDHWLDILLNRPFPIPASRHDRADIDWSSQ
ncbi:Uncharacterised protein [Vibrio cholerae]|nr:Uncharacterised protein [Vibrio cholerae]